MRTFADLQDLSKFLDSPAGTLYTQGSPWPDAMVRHFDAEIPPDRIPAYAEITAAADEWLAGNPDLAELAAIEQPTEIGGDFIARPYRIYEVTTRSYADDAEPPEQLELLRGRLAAALGAPGAGEREAIVRDVIARTLLEPSGRVFFDDTMEQFVAVEPKIRRDDVDLWARAGG